MTPQEIAKALIEELHIADYIYNVRESANEDESFVGNSWDHPRVKRFSEVCDALKRLANEGR